LIFGDILISINLAKEGDVLLKVKEVCVGDENIDWFGVGSEFGLLRSIDGVVGFKTGEEMDADAAVQVTVGRGWDGQLIDRACREGG
jgi:hypothetical protein